MPRRARGSTPKQGGPAKARVATKGLRVTAVKASAGRSATSVNVEIETEELKSEVGEFGEVRGVSAQIPEEGERPGSVRWCNETLRPAGASERETKGGRRTVRQYFNVHYGPSADGQGVGVEVDTDRGKLQAPQPGHAYAIKADSQPGESEIKKKTKPKK